MTNNDILKKLRIALKLRDDNIQEILKLADFEVSKNEINALFRNEDHPNYKECGDQLIRNFLNGLIIYMRGASAEKPKLEENKEIIKTEKRKLIIKKASGKNTEM